MRPEQDAYGRAMLDWLEGRGGYEIVERDDGFVSLAGGPEQYFAPFRRWSAPERRAVRRVRGRALDVGCGAGRWALELQARGHDVVGIDLSPLAVRVCRRRGVRDARVLPVTRVSTALGSFDTVVMMGNNFGLFANERRARWLLRRLHRLTSDRGRILAQSRNIMRAGAPPEHRTYLARNRAQGRLPGEIRMRVRYKTCATPWFSYLMVSPAQMRAILRGTGWHVAEVLESDDPVYVAVIEKS